MNEKSEMLQTIWLLRVMRGTCKPSTSSTMKTGPVPVVVLSEEGDRWICPAMPILLTCHDVFPKQHHVPRGPHLTFQAVEDNYRETVCVSFAPPSLVKRDFCAGSHNSTLYNQQNGMTTQTHGFVTSMMLLHFCIELHCWASWDLQSGWSNYYLYSERGKRPHLLQRGEHLIMALFSHLPKCYRYEHNGKYLTS